jgi:hypothetical protein
MFYSLSDMRMHSVCMRLSVYIVRCKNEHTLLLHCNACGILHLSRMLKVLAYKCTNAHAMHVLTAVHLPTLHTQQSFDREGSYRRQTSSSSTYNNSSSNTNSSSLLSAATKRSSFSNLLAPTSSSSGSAANAGSSMNSSGVGNKRARSSMRGRGRGGGTPRLQTPSDVAADEDSAASSQQQQQQQRRRKRAASVTAAGQASPNDSGDERPQQQVQY